MTPTDQASEDGSSGDLWRNYRIGVGALSAIVGLLAGYVSYGIQMVFAFFAAIVALLSMKNMGGSPPSMSTDITELTIMIGVIGLVIFGGAGYRYARNGSDGRLFVWIAAILSLPLGVGIFSMWVLRQTAPGTNRAPPNKRTVMAVTAGIAIFATVFLAPMAATEFNQYRERVERQDSELFQLIDRRNVEEHVEELRALLEQGADPNQTTKLGTTALMFALEYDDASRKTDEIAALLLDFGADPNTPSRWQEDAEYEVYIRKKQHDDGFIFWLNRRGGLDRLKHGYVKHTPLVIVSSRGNLGLVDLMIEKGANVDAYQAHIEMGNPFIDLLLERGAGQRLYGGPKPESSPITAAISSYVNREYVGGNHVDVVRVLLSHGAAVDPRALSRFERMSSMK